MTGNRKVIANRILVWLALSAAALAANPKTLDIYFVDVEGGQATLIVAPGHESMLIDTGFPGFAGRDTDRIFAAAKTAGLTRLDYVLITHYHRDHVGGVVALSNRIPVGTFLDHGPNTEDSLAAREGYAAYQHLWTRAQHRVLRPGDKIALGAAKIDVVAAAGSGISSDLPGGGIVNANCAREPAAPPDPTENSQSVGLVLTYGPFRFADLGDLTKQKELALACPNNRLGSVDLFLISHHGLDRSNARALVDALAPRVAVMNNGPHKGGDPAAWQIVHDSPRLQDLWQLHRALGTDALHNTDEQMIANLDEDCAGKYLKASVQADGAFTVSNTRNGFSRLYDRKAK